MVTRPHEAAEASGQRSSQHHASLIAPVRKARKRTVMPIISQRLTPIYNTACKNKLSIEFVVQSLRFRSCGTRSAGWHCKWPTSFHLLQLIQLPLSRIRAAGQSCESCLIRRESCVICSAGWVLLISRSVSPSALPNIANEVVVISLCA